MASDAELVIRLLGDSTPEESEAISTSVPRDPGVQDYPRANPNASETTATTRPESGHQSDGTGLERHSLEGAVSDLRETIQVLNDKLKPELFERPVEDFSRNLDRFLSEYQKKESQRSGATESDRNEQHSNSTSQPESNPRSTFGKLRETGRRFLDSVEKRSPTARTIRTGFRLGKAVGQRFTKRARTLATSVGKTRFGKAVTSVSSKVAARFGVGAASTATTAATAATAAPAAASAGAAAIGGVGVAVGGVVAGLAALAIATGVLVKKFHDAADDIERFSPDVSLARARSRANTELNLLDRAQRIGPASGRLEASKGALGNQVEKLLTDLLDLVSKFQPQLSAGINTAEAIVISIRGMVAVIERILGEIEAYKALLTPLDPADDAAAAARNAKAEKDFADRMADLALKLNEAWLNLQGNAQQNQQQIDPMLLQIMNSKFGGP
jgi:hypothetical protein